MGISKAIAAALLALLSLASLTAAESWDRRLEAFLESLGLKKSSFAKLARSRSSAGERLRASSVYLVDSGQERKVADCQDCYSPVKWTDGSVLLLSPAGVMEVNLAGGVAKRLGAVPSGARELLAAKPESREVWFVKRDNSRENCSYSVWKWNASTQAAAADDAAPCLPAIDLATELGKPGAINPPPAPPGKDRFDALWLSDSLSLFLER